MTEEEYQAFLAKGGKVTTCTAGAKTSFKDQIKTWSVDKLVDKLNELDKYLSNFSDEDEDEDPAISQKASQRTLVIKTLLDKWWQKPKAPTKDFTPFYGVDDGDGFRD